MKQILSIAVLVAIIFSSCGKHGYKSVKLKDQTDSVSYLLGLYYAKGAKSSNFTINPEMVKIAFEQVKAGDSIKFSEQEIGMKLQMFYGKIQQEVAKKNLEEGKKFLEENKKKAGVITTASGLQYIIVKEGNGPLPDSADKVSINYRGTTIDDKEFDSSYKRGEPATFPVTGTIPGFTEALLKMKVGSKWKLFIPANLGYGERGAGNTIAPNATIIFELEVLSILPKEPAAPQATIPGIKKR
jgi:FKBP-type peptidyl-prolyl cis-trans isomerase FklB